MYMYIRATSTVDNAVVSICIGTIAGSSAIGGIGGIGAVGDGGTIAGSGAIGGVGTIVGSGAVGGIGAGVAKRLFCKHCIILCNA